MVFNLSILSRSLRHAALDYLVRNHEHQNAGDGCHRDRPEAATLLATAGDAEPAKDGDIKSDSAQKAETPSPKPEKLGVLINDSRAFPGYNLISPGRKQTYLYDNEGRVVHSWTSEYTSGAAVYLVDNGHLLRPSEVVDRKPVFQGPAVSGRFQEFDWDGNLVWNFEYHSEKRLPHHDAITLPQRKRSGYLLGEDRGKEAVAAGRRPETVKDSHLQPDCLVEIKPTCKTTGEIVWEWRSLDHLIQDRDKTKPNYGKVTEHPELFDLNYIHGEENRVSKLMATNDGRDKLRSLGYLGSGPAGPTVAKKDLPKKARKTKTSTRMMHRKPNPRTVRRMTNLALRVRIPIGCTSTQWRTTPNSTRSPQQPQLSRDLDHRP